jgi:hypothetical protein
MPGTSLGLLISMPPIPAPPTKALTCQGGKGIEKKEPDYDLILI